MAILVLAISSKTFTGLHTACTSLHKTALAFATVLKEGG
jgi:hypothetical protein